MRRKSSLSRSMRPQARTPSWARSRRACATFSVSDAFSRIRVNEAAHVAHAVLKSTGSAFESFVRDEYTTLAEVNDRIFSTSVDLVYTFKPFAIKAPKDNKKLEFDVANVGDAAKVRPLSLFRPRSPP